MPCFLSEINQGFSNIILNATEARAEKIRKSGAGKGALTVITRQDEEWVEIQISDTGTGIPAPVRDKLFDPFYTTKATGKRGGLGLSIAHFIIERKHGGKITFETKLGSGTTFIIRLPLTIDEPSLEVQQYLY